MKRYLLIVLFALIVPLLPAQSPVDEPSLQPDMMTYFQDEMTSLMRFQIEQKQNTSFFSSVSLQLVKLSEEAKSDYLFNMASNVLAGFQLKLGNNLYLPLYFANTYTQILGVPDEGALKTIDSYPLSMTRFDERNINYLAGTGLYFTGAFFRCGVFTAYHYNQNSTTVKVFDSLEDNDNKEIIYRHKDENAKHNFKLALLPAVDTSKWRYVGTILNNALGYLGMGDAIQVYSGAEENKDQGTAAIVTALNYALDLGFSSLELGNTRVGLRGFYRRDSYDAAARNDVYGGKLTAQLATSFTGYSTVLQASFECGFMHFNSISPYFTTRYHDTMFYDIGLSATLDEKFLYKFFWRYDEITNWRFGLTLDISRAATLFVSAGTGDKKVGAFMGTLGGRYRKNAGVLN